LLPADAEEKRVRMQLKAQAWHAEHKEVTTKQLKSLVIGPYWPDENGKYSCDQALAVKLQENKVWFWCKYYFSFYIVGVSSWFGTGNEL
jgi:hypothetical protein